MEKTKSVFVTSYYNPKHQPFEILPGLLGTEDTV